jgi:hypothetical protein
VPVLLDTPELIECIEPHAIPAACPQARRACPGFWRRLARGLRWHLTPTPYERHVPADGAHRPFETPMDRYTREHTSLSIYALAIV